MAVCSVGISSTIKLMLAAVFAAFFALNINIPLSTCGGCCSAALKSENEKPNASLINSDCFMMKHVIKGPNRVMCHNITGVRSLALYIVVYELEYVNPRNVYFIVADRDGKGRVSRLASFVTGIYLILSLQLYITTLKLTCNG